MLLFPHWTPGSHSPTGHLDQLGGLKVTARGKPVTWCRDQVDIYAFHVDVPDGATSLHLEYQNLSAPEGVWPRVATPAILDLDWASVILYPAEHFSGRITYRPSVTLPARWAFASALEGQQRISDTVSWSRSADDYPEGELIWLDVDTLIRERSHGRRSLDDFARAFGEFSPSAVKVRRH